MALIGQPSPHRGLHPVLYPAQFYSELPVGSILYGIGVCRMNVYIMIMESGSDLASEKESPADADGSDGIEFVSVKKDLCLGGTGKIFITESVGGDTVGDLFDIHPFKADPGQDRSGQFGPFGRMADLPFTLALISAADVMEQGGGTEDVKTSVHLAADLQGCGMDPEGMVEPVAASFILMEDGCGCPDPLGDLESEWQVGLFGQPQKRCQFDFII